MASGKPEPPGSVSRLDKAPPLAHRLAPMARMKKSAKNAVVGKAKPAARSSKQAPDITADMAPGSADGLPVGAHDTPPGHARGERLRALFEVAEDYGRKSFDNYARIRSVAETLRDEFCAWLSEEPGCVFLVPPEGRFTAKNYQSAAFSVAGKGYLPLKPISFGLAVLVSEDKDFMRVKLTCRKEGEVMTVRIENGRTVKVPLAEDGEAVDGPTLEPLYTAIYEHILGFFQERVDDYDNGRYGVTEIGFDLQRMTGA